MLVPALVGPYQLAALYAAAHRRAGLARRGRGVGRDLGVRAAYFFTLPVIPQLFPDGRPLSPRWRRVVVAVLVVAVLTTLARMVSDVTRRPRAAGRRTRSGSRAPTGRCTSPWSARPCCSSSASRSAVLSLFLRMRRARDVERTQLQWLFLGGIVLVVGIVLEFGGAGRAVGARHRALRPARRDRRRHAAARTVRRRAHPQPDRGLRPAHRLRGRRLRPGGLRRRRVRPGLALGRAGGRRRGPGRGRRARPGAGGRRPAAVRAPPQPVRRRGPRRSRRRRGLPAGRRRCSGWSTGCARRCGCRTPRSPAAASASRPARPSTAAGW